MHVLLNRYRQVLKHCETIDSRPGFKSDAKAAYTKFIIWSTWCTILKSGQIIFIIFSAHGVLHDILKDFNNSVFQGLPGPPGPPGPPGHTRGFVPHGNATELLEYIKCEFVLYMIYNIMQVKLQLNTTSWHISYIIWYFTARGITGPPGLSGQPGLPGSKGEQGMPRFKQIKLKSWLYLPLVCSDNF